jgi:hypothetical protein
MGTENDFSALGISTYSLLVSASLTNAFYTNLLLKKQTGVEITPEIEDQALHEVEHVWLNLSDMISETALKVRNQNEPGPPG